MPSMFDTERFIREIELRPAIWRQYSGDNRETKTGEWQQVARAMYQDWDSWSPLRQNEAGRELQKKWKNIKDNFTKALKEQKVRESGGNGKRRRKYIYFNMLSFLLTSDVKKEKNEEIEEMEEMEEMDDINCDALLEIPVETQLDENVEFLDPQMPIIHEPMHQSANIIRKRRRKVPYKPLEERLLTLLDKRQKDCQKNVEEMDEDRAFFLSLLPSVRRLNDEQKIEFRLEMLNCLRRLHYQKPHEVVVSRSSRSNKRTSNSYRNQEPSSSIGKCDDDMDEA